MDCYECEEAKGHAEEAKNHWIRKTCFVYYRLIFVCLVTSLCFAGPGWNLIIIHKNTSVDTIFFTCIGTLLFLFSVAMLTFRFYQEIFKGISLYCPKTADGVLHAHLKNPFPGKRFLATKAVKDLSVPALLKIGVCGWFRNSTIISYKEVGAEIDTKPKVNGKIELGSTKPLYCISNNYKGLKIHKARCDEKTFELKSVTLEDEVGDRISFNNVGEIYELLEYLDKDITSTPYKIACLFGKIKCLRGFFEMLVEGKKEKGEELKTAQAELEKQKELILDYANFEGSLTGWLKGSKDNPNLGKSKHAQVIRQKLEQHAKEVWEKYGLIMAHCMPE